MNSGVRVNVEPSHRAGVVNDNAAVSVDRDTIRKELEGKGTNGEGGSLDYGSQIDGGGGKLQLRGARFVSCKRDTSVNQVHNQ
ncbi:hypothetical protein EAG_04171 [Camponotus floridanus]|uniref:Uncharacterized protein n=1 Tax=Camponotus floridanus TaxID=104421 RepID=E2AAX1_CAMFO|nr:hypothetical protein EAG_04171 [Camponotus floridanus]